MAQLIIFLLGTVGFVILSRRALIEHHLYGFPRFFAFEAILGLVVLNAGEWFSQPFSLLQLISWVLLLDSAYLAIHAILVFRAHRLPQASIQANHQLVQEKAPQLITSGPYRFIRHPLYASLLFLGWGVFLKQVTVTTFLLVIIASLCLFLTAVYEERENLLIFGDDYATYMQHTKRFIPFII
jgi:protein-S-isoprenylcysteine O-methyltransferase Ste14